MVRVGRKDKNNNTFYRKNVETAEKSWERFGLERECFLVGETGERKDHGEPGGAKAPDQAGTRSTPPRLWSNRG